MSSRMTIMVSIASLLTAFIVLPSAWDGARAQSGTMQHRHMVPAQEKPASTEAEEPVFSELPGYGKKCWIGDTLYFTYDFVKKPKMGTAILRVQLFDKKGKRATGLDILGVSDMPSMRGAHDSGEVPFKLNKKGDYLLPVNVVMPGEWEVKLIFMKDKEPVFRGRFGFDI